MNISANRVGLAIATLAVIVTIGGAYVADGYLSAQRAASTPPTMSAGDTSPTPTATLPPEVVYVRPAPSPKIIRVTRQTRPAAPKVVHVIVPSTGGERSDSGEADGGAGD